MPTTSSPATAMRYRDVAAAVDWLCSAFGFEKQTVLRDDAGAPIYAQLTFGRAMLMIAPVGDTPIEKFMKQPDEIGGAETQSCYFVVADADAHHARAKAAGAEIVLDVEDDNFGGRGYTCRDLEEHIWTFGTYDPWQGEFPQPEVQVPSGGKRRIMLGGLTAVVIASVGFAAWFSGALTQSSAVSSTGQVQSGQNTPSAPSAALAAAEQAVREVRAQLERERAARAAADKSSEEAQKRAAEAQQGREAAERAAKQSRADLERATKAAATPSAEIMKRVDEETRAREAAERSAKQARAELEKVLAAKTAAEMAKEFALGRAEEEQLAREAAERAAQEARAELERLAAAKQGEGASGAGAPRGALDVQKALDEAQKRAADEQRAREAAERATKEAREQLAKEQAAKAAAWKVIGQLSKQLKIVKGDAAAPSAADDDNPPPKKPRPIKKAPPPDQ